jgi:hypothetical protein
VDFLEVHDEIVERCQDLLGTDHLAAPFDIQCLQGQCHRDDSSFRSVPLHGEEEDQNDTEARLDNGH